MSTSILFTLYIDVENPFDIQYYPISDFVYHHNRVISIIMNTNIVKTVSHVSCCNMTNGAAADVDFNSSPQRPEPLRLLVG